MNARRSFIAVSGLAMLLAAALTGCQGETNVQTGIAPRKVADALHALMESDRTVYTQHVVNRLTEVHGVIEASEHWKEEPALPLPAQMFRMGAELVAEKEAGFTYSLLSLWPINSQNRPRTQAEEDGLQFTIDNEGQNFYAEETLGGKPYFTAVYADKAISQACVSCHNAHRDTPRTDFALGDVMGGIVIRIPLDP